MSGYLSPDEVARLLGVDRKTVYAAIHDGRLPALKLGRVLRVRESDLEALAFRPGTDPASPARRRRQEPVGEFTAKARGTVR